MLIMTVISFIIGLSISGQTFYTFILENIEKFGALKAIGAKGSELVSYDPVSGVLCGPDGIWHRCWPLLTDDMAGAALSPDYAAIITYPNLVLAFVMVVIIAAISSYIGVRKVLKIEPFDIFRG